MNRTPSRKAVSGSSTRKTGLALSLAVACNLFAGVANAQWTVIDPAAIAQDAANFATTVQQYGAEVQNFTDQATRWSSTVQQYTSVLQHYEQQLIKLQSLNFTLLQAKNNFSKRDPGQDVQLFCPGSTTSLVDIGALVRQFTADLGGNIAQQQQQVCSNIVQLQDAKFNDTVDIIQKLTDENNTEIQQIETQRNSVGTAQGALDANQNETARFVARTNVDIQAWQTKMHAYDVQIEFLKAQQSALANRAMNGDSSNPNLLGEATQTAVLTTALKIGN
ncbi:MAG: DUF4141 domain-containing protein [Pseudomonadota bacterium]|jgi:Mg2+ and Co2+ transporter CorA